MSTSTTTKKPNPTPIKETAEEVIEEAAAPVRPDFYTIRLPKSREDKEDQVVWVNDKRYIIKRGVDVTVPRAVYDILRHKEQMLMIIDKFEEAQENKHK